VYAAPKEYHVRRDVEHDPRALGESILRGQKHDAFVAIGGITVNSALSFSPLPRIARQPFNES